MNIIAKEGEFCCNICEDMGVLITRPNISLTDNKGAFDTASNPGATKRTAHYERWLQFARDLCLKNKIKCVLISTHKMRADIFTKIIERPKFIPFRKEIMNLRNDQSI